MNVKSLISYKSLLPLAVIVLSLLVLFFTRSLPVTKIWKSYQVLYVQQSVPEDEVLDVLEKESCKDVISLSKQRIPVFSKIAPVQPCTEDSYLFKRNAYFHDEDGKYMLYYIPEVYEKQTEKALTFLVKQKNLKAGLDGHSTFPYLVPLICLAFYVFLITVSEHKKLFASGGFFILFFSLVNPYYPVVAALCLEFLALFLLQKYWKREKALAVFYKNVGIDILFICGYVIIFSFSWKCGLLFIFVILSVLASILLCYRFEAEADLKKSFDFELILPAKYINVYSKKNRSYILLSSLCLFGILLCFLLGARFLPQTSVSDLSLPCPSSAKENKNISGEDNKIPSMNEYFAWCWNTVTFPYRNLNKGSKNEELIAQKGSRLTLTRYRSTKKGIESYEELVAEYDSAFFDSMEHEVDNLSYPAIEKLMKKQGRSATVHYSQKSYYNSGRDFKAFILLIIAMVIPLIVYLYYNVSVRFKVFGSKKNEDSK